MAPSVVFDVANTADNGAGVAYVSASSFTPTANHRYLLMLVYGHASATPVVPTSMTHAGTGLTITRREDMAYKTSGSNRTALAVYSLDAGPSVTGGTFSTTWAAAMIGCGWTVVDLDTYGAVWANKAEHGGVIAAAATQTATLAAAPADTTTSRPMLFASSNGVAGWAVEAAWTELQENAQLNPSMTRMVGWNATAWDATAAITNNTGAGPAAGLIAIELMTAPPAGLIPYRVYSWEGGTDAGALATNAAIGIGGQSGTNTYTTDAIHGTLALRSTNGTFYATHQSGFTYGINDDGAGQADIYWQVEAVTGNDTIFQISPNSTNRSQVRARSDGKVEIAPIGGTAVATTGSWTTNQWHRVSVRWTARSANAFTITARVYWVAESTTYEEISAAASTTEIQDRLYFGSLGTGSVGVLDTIRVYPDVSSWPEPVNPTQVENVSAAGSATGTASATITPAHTVTAGKSMLGTAAAAVTSTHTVAAAGSATGTASAAVVSSHTVTASASMIGTASATVTGGGPQVEDVTANAAMIGTASASIAPAHALTATASATGTAAATTTPTHVLTAAASLTGTATATVYPHASLVAAAGMTGTASATIFAGQLVTGPDRTVTFPAVGRTVEIEAVAHTVTLPAIDRNTVLEPTGRVVEFPAETRELVNA